MQRGEGLVTETRRTLKATRAGVVNVQQLSGAVV
jgi:hypothetical protein